MSITTWSQFLYGFTVTATNNLIPFSENSGAYTLNASLEIGSYSATEYFAHVADKMTSASAASGLGQEYTVTFNRVTRIVTIAAANSFELLCATGLGIGSDAYPTLGFSNASDKTGAATYDSDTTAGSLYRPQAILKNYIGPDKFRLKEKAVVSESADGTIVQTASFGDGQRIQMNIWLANSKNVTFANGVVETNVTGVADILTFMDFAITKAKMEFMADRDSPDSFYTVMLESTGADGKGTAYILEQMDADSFYQTNDITFRVLT